VAEKGRKKEKGGESGRRREEGEVEWSKVEDGRVPKELRLSAGGSWFLG